MRTHAARAFIFAALACLAAMSDPVLAETYYVRQKGDDRADGKTAATAFKTIQRAAQVLNHGDSIVIGPGTYRETVVIAERHIAGWLRMTIEGDETGKRTGDTAGPVVIEPASASEPALRFYRCDWLRFSGLTLRGTGDGLALEKCKQVGIERCTFAGLRRGLSVRLTQWLEVERCVFSRCTIGLSLQAVMRTSVEHVTAVNNSCAGLLALSCGSGTVRNSILAANNTNMLVDSVSAPSWRSDDNVIHGTTGPWGLGPSVYFAHEWPASSGQDRHSVYVVPAFVDPQHDDLHIDPTVTWGAGLPGMTALEPMRIQPNGAPPFTIRRDRVCAGAYDYPEPTPAPGWRKLPVALHWDLATDPFGPRQSAGIYRPDGTLVRMLVSDAAGVRDLWWDGLDDSGQPAPAGEYQVRSVSHDVQLLDDGGFGDNGNPLGTYNADNPERIVALADGRFVVTAGYDEAGIPVRFYAASGQSVAGMSLTEKDIWAIAPAGDEFIIGVGGSIARLVVPGNRARMANGAESYPILAAGEQLEKGKTPTGVAVVGGTAYVALPGLDLVRGIDLATGQKKSDWKVAAVADLAADEKGGQWAISGTDVVLLGADGAAQKRYATGLAAPRYLAAGTGKLAVVDRDAARIAVMDAASGKVIRTLGAGLSETQWMPVSGDVLLNPRGAAFLPDGRLLVAESGRVRALWPDTAQVSFTVESNFMDVAVPHPTQPEYVYCYRGTVFHVDPATGAWERKAEAASGPALGAMSTNVVLNGKPFIVAFDAAFAVERLVDGLLKKVRFSRISFLDVTDPLKPRLATVLEQPEQWAYATIAFTREGHMVMRGPSRTGGYSLNFKIVPCTGLDAQGNPGYDFEKARVVGPETDPTPRGMGHNCGITIDPAADDIYYMAVTAQHNKMVPAWGASGSGVGKSKADGTPQWFSLSSGGNYTSIDCVRTGENVWVMAAKDFGGQIDLFDADGLRLTTGNVGWASNWQMGFVDMRYAVQCFVGADGKPRAYVEDDCIGRFMRVRLDGAETLKKSVATFQWDGVSAPAGPPPVADRIGADRPIAQPLAIPKVADLKVDGDWGAWEKAGVTPQIISLPAVSWGRSWPDDLFQTFRSCTSIGALAHDGKNLYAYFVVTDDTMHFDTGAGQMWMNDGVELWVEEEQIGIGFVKDGRPAVFKYRYHNREGKEWAAGYALAAENVWGRKYDDLSAHPLARQLGVAVGASLEGKPGYALMAKVPFDEIKLVGGIAGRGGKDILPTTGKAGEIIRVGVAFDGVSAWGREQDYKVYWPSGLMFSDPTRNVPFAFGE